MPKKPSKHVVIELDSPWKYAMRHFFRSFMEFCLPEWAASIDWAQGYETLDKELQKIIPESETGKRFSDMLFKVWLKNGEEKWILIHLEIQGQNDKELAQRMFIYNYRTYDQYQQQPVVSIALLLDADPKWRPDYFRLQNPLEKEKSFLEFRYHVIKLIDYATRKEELQKRNDLFSKVILAQLIVMETKKNLPLRVQHKISLIKQLLKLGLTNHETRELYQFIDWLMIIPEDLMLTYKEKINEIAEDMMEEWDVPYIPSSVKIARIEGRQEGIRLLLDRQIRRRFPHTVTAQHLHLINDANVETLARWAEKLMDAKKVEEVFAVQ
ncbi:MAG: Rpn family recombination-promoting nuclease/putative transposase [Chthoniobacterales bacterium]|nr:Rpn family recombination-promoting nuclease/putative transposase [Chthoniobacterales bacterium]